MNIERDEDGTEFVATHPYLTDGQNRPVRFVAVLKEKCPACEINDLGVTHNSKDAQTVHCLKCDYTLTRRPPPVYRPMNSGGYNG